MSALTQAERDTLNAAEQILVNMLVSDEVLMFSLHHGWEGISLTYFTPNKAQHGWLQARDDHTFAGKIDRALEIRAAEEGNADHIKAERIAALKAELAALDVAA